MHIRRFLNGTTYLRSPDKESGSGTDEEILEDEVVEEEVAEQEEQPFKPQTPRESIKAAIAEAKAKADAEEDDQTPKPKAKVEAKPGEKPGKDSKSATAPKPGAAKSSSATPGSEANVPAAKTVGDPPASWNTEEKKLWSSLPDAAKTAVLRHDQNTVKGVNDLRTRYTELDSAIAPYREHIKQFRGPTGQPISEAQAVQQLFQWQTALEGPNKANAFLKLAQSCGLDLSTITSGTTVQPNNAQLQIPPEFRQVIDGLVQKVNGFEANSAAQVKSAAEQHVTSWAADKPHFEKVRNVMAQLTQAGVVPLLNGHVDLDGAYKAAIKLDPELSAQVNEEERAAKEAATAAARAEKLRKAKAAGTSIKPAAPAAATSNNAAKPIKNESVRDSIKRALAEVSA